MNTSLETFSQLKNLKLLFQLRSIAIIAQIISVVVAYVFFGLNVAVEPMLLVIAILAMINVFTFYRLKSNKWRNSFNQHEVFVQLLIDVLGLAVLIYFSGGISNPFIGFFILQVVISAILLKPVQTWIIVALTGGAYLFLSYHNYEVPGLGHDMHHAGHSGHGSSEGRVSGFNLHLHGMFFSYVIVAVLVAFFVVRMAKNLKERDQELYRIQQQAVSETEVMKLGMLAAGAAHELGTPLNAIQLATDELKASLEDQAELQPTLNLLSRQVSRCCQSVNDLMTVVRQPRALNASEVEINSLLKEVAENWSHLNPNKQLMVDLSRTVGLVIVADKLLSQSCINLLDNAARVSESTIGLMTSQDEAMVNIIVEDTGPGMPERIREMLNQQLPITDEQGNVRLGLFLVNTLVQRLGGSLTFGFSESGQSQVVLSIPWVAPNQTKLGK